MIFFCDVDLVFDANLVNRIRFFVKKNEVYFPIFFSQYELVPSGFWRTFSYGMVAFQYEDFLQTGGFDLEKVLVKDKFLGVNFENFKFKSFLTNERSVGEKKTLTC